MRVLLVLALAFGAVIAAPKTSSRIVGGNPTTINYYPSVAALLFSFTGSTFKQACGGAILNNRSVMTVAQCTYQDAPYRWRFRVGATEANDESQGVTYQVSSIITHNNFQLRTMDNDIAILRTTGNIAFVANAVQPASIPQTNFVLGDTQPVWAVGWGATEAGGEFSDVLQDVQLWSINQAVCEARYAEIQMEITDNMLCAGLLDTGGRDQCQGDAGSPVYHGGVVVGLSSFGFGCGQARYPGVNTRVNRYTAWIQMNA